MNKNDTYKGKAWTAFFDDGFHITTQVILGSTMQEAVKNFEAQTGFNVIKAVAVKAKS